MKTDGSSLRAQGNSILSNSWPLNGYFPIFTTRKLITDNSLDKQRRMIHVKGGVARSYREVMSVTDRE